MSEFGCQSMALPVKRVLMRRPGESLRRALPEDWNYGPAFDAERAIDQYERFAALVAQAGPDVIWIEDNGDGLADAMFTHDPSLVSDQGAILLNMGKDRRRSETDLHETAYARNGIPVLGRITGSGTVEGGDCIWLDRQTLVVGRGVRTNQAGIGQLSQILSPHGVAVHGFDLPLWHGEDACLHLMSIISPLDEDMALVYAPLLPVALHAMMKDAGYRLIHAPESEFAASNGLCLNVLPTAPGQVIMVAGFPETTRMMEEAGCNVSTFEADALCIACEGGPTCLTRPILRRAA